MRIWPFFCCVMADSDTSENEWSDNKFWGGMGALSVGELRENDERHLQALLDNSDSDADSVSDNDDALPVDTDYVAPETWDWSRDYSVQCVRQFREKTGPVRILNSDATPLELFQIFYSDEVFEHIVTCTNANVQNKIKCASMITIQLCSCSMILM